MIRRTTAALLTIAALALANASPTEAQRMTAMGAYEHAQNLRQEAEALVAKAPSPASYRTAAVKLQEALDYLALPEVRELATGNIYLYARNYDVLRDLASIHAQLSEKDEALRLLELMHQEAWNPVVAKWLQEDPAFAPLRDEPRYKALFATMQATERLWGTPAIATPYKDKLAVEERIAGLSLFWAEARQNFAYFDHVPDLEWDRVYLEYLPKVMAVESTQDYYRVLMQLAPLLRDGHTNIYPPQELARRFYGRPPLRTERIEGRVYVTQVRSPSLDAQVKVGDEIIAVDSLPVDQHVEQRVAPYASSSTAQDRAVRFYDYQFLAGDADQPVQLRLRDAAGAERNQTIARSGYTDLRQHPEFVFKMLPDGIAYLAVDHFESEAGVQAFERALPEILKAKGLILDLRDNGGGSSDYGLAILSYLTPAPLHTGKSRYRGESGLDRARNGGAAVRWKVVPGDGEPYTQDRKVRFAGPVAVLIGPRTFSAAEDFAMYFDVAKRGLLIGSATAGSTGQPLSFKLPGGGSARICVKRDTYPDGREFVGRGITPQINVGITVTALRAGTDPVLERASSELAGR